jgi:hypothetical protein
VFFRFRFWKTGGWFAALAMLEWPDREEW